MAENNAPERTPTAVLKVRNHETGTDFEIASKVFVGMMDDTFLKGNRTVKKYAVLEGVPMPKPTKKKG